MNLKQHIGLRVKVARRAQQLSQDQLAEHIDRTTETVSNIERAVTVPSIETLQRLARVLDIPLTEFFEADNTTTSNQKRLRVEMEIRQCLSRLSFSQLKIASIQIQALENMDEA